MVSCGSDRVTGVIVSFLARWETINFEQKRIEKCSEKALEFYSPVTGNKLFFVSF